MTPRENIREEPIEAAIRSMMNSDCDRLKVELRMDQERALAEVRFFYEVLIGDWKKYAEIFGSIYREYSGSDLSERALRRLIYHLRDKFADLRCLTNTKHGLDILDSDLIEDEFERNALVRLDWLVVNGDGTVGLSPQAIQLLESFREKVLKYDVDDELDAPAKSTRRLIAERVLGNEIDK